MLGLQILSIVRCSTAENQVDTIELTPLSGTTARVDRPPLLREGFDKHDPESQKETNGNGSKDKLYLKIIIILWFIFLSCVTFGAFYVGVYPWIIKGLLIAFYPLSILCFIFIYKDVSRMAKDGSY